MKEGGKKKEKNKHSGSSFLCRVIFFYDSLSPIGKAVLVYNQLIAILTAEPKRELTN